VRQLAAALRLGLMQIIADNWAIHKGASELAHSKGFASDKKYAALGFLPATARRKCAFLSKQSHADNKSAVSDKLGRRDGGAPRTPSDKKYAALAVSAAVRGET